LPNADRDEDFPCSFLLPEKAHTTRDFSSSREH
jgi:hypothetical protein